MHKAERAIIMGAGMGTRLRPVTDNLPKPLVRVNGVRIIDTVIGALRANGIREIHIVTGYRADRKSTRLNSSHPTTSRMPSSA